MKKLLTLIIAVGLFVLTWIALAKEGGNPFNVVWEKLTSLQEQVDAVGPGFISAPAFDSGWISMTNGSAGLIRTVDVPHSVGGDTSDYFIQTSYKKWDGSLITYKSEPDFVWV